MARGETLFIGSEYRSRFLFQAKKTKNGIVVDKFRVEYDAQNKPKAVPNIAGTGRFLSVIDCGEYTTTTMRLDGKDMEVFFTIPVNDYVCDMDEEKRAEYDTDRVIRSETEYGNSINVHLAGYNEDTHCFRQMVITRDEEDGEKAFVQLYVADDGSCEIYVTGEKTVPHF